MGKKDETGVSPHLWPCLHHIPQMFKSENVEWEGLFAGKVLLFGPTLPRFATSMTESPAGRQSISIRKGQ